MREMIGQTLSHYRITQKLGAGGLVNIYKAYDLDSEQYVILQIPRQELLADPQFCVRFKEESKRLDKLKHPHLINTLTYGEDSGIPFSVHPYLQLKSLQEVLAQGVIPLIKVDQILSQISSALDFAHLHGVLHRDVKPTNISIDSADNAYLIDFGMAAILGDKTDEHSQIMVGTPYYLSPEQCRGDELDARSDIYSLGIVLYEMITGKPPFEGSTPMAVVFKHISEPVPSPHTLRPDLPEAIDQIVYKVLAKNPQLRYQTAGAFAAAFSRVIRDVPTSDISLSTPIISDRTDTTLDGPAKRVRVPELQKKNNPWISGSFYLFAAIVLMTLLAVISANISWYAVAVVFIAGLLTITIIGALQLRNDDTLGEESFLSLMIQSLKLMPLLKKDGLPNETQSENKPSNERDR